MTQDNKIPQHASMFLFAYLLAIKSFFVLNNQNNRTFTHTHALRFLRHWKQRHQFLQAMLFFRARLTITYKDLCFFGNGNNGFVWHISEFEIGKNYRSECNVQKEKKITSF